MDGEATILSVGGSSRRREEGVVSDFDPLLWPELLDDVPELGTLEDARTYFYRTVLEAVDAGVVIADRAGVARAANPAAARILGIESDELIGSTVYDERWQSVDEEGKPWPPEDAPTTRALTDQVAPNGEVIGVHRPDGSIVWVSVNARPLRRTPDDASYAVVTTYTDISLFKEAQARLRDADRRMQQAEHLESLGQLAGGVAHDFNNVLMVIRGYAEALLAVDALDSRPRSKVERIIRAVDRAGAMVDGLLSFSSTPALTHEPVGLNDIIDDAADVLADVLGDDIRLELELDPVVGSVLTDRVRFERLLLNLATNARDAMPGGGRLSIRTQRVQLSSASPSLPQLTAGNYAVAVITDEGVGMSAEVRTRLFEPFFTTKHDGQHHGLGLASGYGVVVQSGGHISVESTPGLGTTFRIYLPEVDVPPIGGAERQWTVPDRPTATGKLVLVAEDESDVLRLVADTLRDHGFVVLEAADGRAATDLLRDLREQLALLVTDVMMDGSDGHAVARTARASRPELPVIFMSGVSRDLPADGMRNALLLSKPFSLDQLVAEAHRLTA